MSKYFAAGLCALMVLAGAVGATTRAMHESVQESTFERLLGVDYLPDPEGQG